LELPARCRGFGSNDPCDSSNPQQFDTDLYKHLPTSDQIDEAHANRSGLPSTPLSLALTAGKRVSIVCGLGTVFRVAGGKPITVCDCAGSAPFGFGCRLCPGEQLTVHVFEDLLRKLWNGQIEFVTLHLPSHNSS
jgi:hypothetical protein